MVITSMALQDQTEGAHSITNVLADSEHSLGGSLNSMTALRLKEMEQLSCGNDFAPKVRKPYTMSKQRERWTEEEHKKFLEALKLYGRAWQRIEAHVGNKTAVQIRSHAQKFFSKVVREASGGNTSSVEPIQIPPPRPKRKPTRPYPRKLRNNSLNKETSIPEQPMRPASPISWASEHENQSPTSVLSAVGSDALVSNDSNTHNDSGSPVSATAGEHAVGIALSNENRCSSPVPLSTGFVPHEHVQVKLELFPKDSVLVKEVAAEEASTRCLKLFGRTVLVASSHRSSSRTTVSYKSVSKEKHVHASLGNSIATATESPSEKTDCSWRHLSQGEQNSLCFMQFQSTNSDRAETDTPFRFLPLQNAESMREHRYRNISEDGYREIQKEGSWTSSSNEKRKEGGWGMQLGSSEISAFSNLKGSSEESVKGFVSYKRCLSERDTQSTMVTSEDREGQRVRLCL